MSDVCLKGARILVVEDEFIIALDLSATLTRAGAEIVGPVATLAEAAAAGGQPQLQPLSGAALVVEHAARILSATAQAARLPATNRLTGSLIDARPSGSTAAGTPCNSSSMP